jgi:hypothetical protein
VLLAGHHCFWDVHPAKKKMKMIFVMVSSRWTIAQCGIPALFRVEQEPRCKSAKLASFSKDWDFETSIPSLLRGVLSGFHNLWMCFDDIAS